MVWQRQGRRQRNGTHGSNTGGTSPGLQLLQQPQSGGEPQFWKKGRLTRNLMPSLLSLSPADGYCKHTTAECRGVGPPKQQAPHVQKEKGRATQCIYCDSKEHASKECPKLAESQSRRLLCWNCGQVGHRVANCPTDLDADIVQQNAAAFTKAVQAKQQFTPIQSLKTKISVLLDHEPTTEEAATVHLPWGLVKCLEYSYFFQVGVCFGNNKQGRHYFCALFSSFLKPKPMAYSSTKSG